MANLTLPQIVSQIREQKPGVVPLSLWLDDARWCDTGCSNTYRMTEETVIFVLEAALWRVVVRRSAHGYGSLHIDMKNRAAFDADPLALIRALCHAIGVTLSAPDCPHRRTTRDASGGIVCDKCGEEITRG